MQIVPLQPVPAQQVNVLLGGQNCTLRVYQKTYGLFVDVLVENALIVGGVIAQNLNFVVRDTYLGFVGDILFVDNKGASDPDWTGLGDRFSLAYLTPADIEALA